MNALSRRLMFAIALAAGALHAPALHAASSGTVVGANVPSSTSISTALCPDGAPGVTSFGPVPVDTSNVTTTDCEVRFGSSNDTSMLRVFQADGGGDAMVAGPTRATLGYWPMNGDLRDVSAAGNDGAALPAAPNDPAYGAGGAARGQALQFDGNDHASIPHLAAYNATTFTVDAWYRGTSTNDVVASRQSTTCGSSGLCQWQLWIGAGGVPYATAEVGATEHAAGGATPVNDGQWHHLAMTVEDATKTLRVFVDGQLAGTDATWTSGSVDTGALGIHVGRSANGLDALTGDVDELRFQVGVASPAAIRQYASARVRDYGAAGSLWSGAVTSAMFGACLESTLDGAAVDASTWTVNPGCPATDGPGWKAIVASGVTAGSKIAHAPAGSDAKARLRFGFRVGSSLPPGSYTAPLVFETIAPAV